ncbi:MAG: hypothetical protein AABZ12_10970 [Planctomycetota bacterium]
MSNSSNNPSPLILWIDSAAAPPGDLAHLSVGVCGFLEANRTWIDLVDNAYVGLARLLKPTGAGFRHAIVRVDRLLPAEFEFFRLAARNRPDVATYVYGGANSASLLNEAIQAGAEGTLTEDVLRRIEVETERGEPKATEEAPSPCPLPRGRGRGVEDEPPHPARSPENGGEGLKTKPPRLAAFSQEERELREAVSEGERELRPSVSENEGSEVRVDEEGDSESASHDEASRPIRVPWLRYGNQPPRKGPSSGGSNGSDSPGASSSIPTLPIPSSDPSLTTFLSSPPGTLQTGSSSPASDVPSRTEPARAAASGTPSEPRLQEPLLTDEELEALLGNDFSAFVPEEREGLLGDEGDIELRPGEEELR